MTGETVKVDGLDTLNRSLATFARSLDDLSGPARGATTRVLNDARRRAPMRSGRLASSGFATPGATESVVGFSARHAGPIHFGVGPRVGLRGPHNITARPFLYGALDATADAVVADFTAEVDDRLSRVKGA